MAYARPPFLVRRVFNPLAMRFRIGGATTLVVPRRGSQKPQRIPVIPVEHDGARYLVSTRGESEWVRNQYRKAAGRVEQYWRTLPNPADHPAFRIEPR